MEFPVGIPPLNALRAYRFRVEHEALPEYIYLKAVYLARVGAVPTDVLILHYRLYKERDPFDPESLRGEGDIEPIEVEMLDDEGKTTRTYRFSGLSFYHYAPFGELDMASDAPIQDEIVFAYQSCELVNNT